MLNLLKSVKPGDRIWEGRLLCCVDYRRLVMMINQPPSWRFEPVIPCNFNKALDETHQSSNETKNEAEAFKEQTEC